MSAIFLFSQPKQHNLVPRSSRLTVHRERALLPMCLPNPLAIVKLYDCGKERYNTFSVNC